MKKDRAEAKVYYDEMIIMTGYSWCWACGHDERQCPKDWYAPFYLEKAHLGHGSGVMFRQEVRRAVNILCAKCHLLHTPLNPVRVSGEFYEPLTSGNMLWLKRLYDPEWYDLEYLAAAFIQTLPLPEPLPDYYNQEYEMTKGSRPAYNKALSRSGGKNDNKKKRGRSDIPSRSSRARRNAPDGVESADHVQAGRSDRRNIKKK